MSAREFRLSLPATDFPMRPREWAGQDAKLLSDMLGVSQVGFWAGPLRHEPCEDIACPRCKRRQPLLASGLCGRCDTAEAALRPS